MNINHAIAGMFVGLILTEVLPKSPPAHPILLLTWGVLIILHLIIGWED